MLCLTCVPGLCCSLGKLSWQAKSAGKPQLTLPCLVLLPTVLMCCILSVLVVCQLVSMSGPEEGAPPCGIAFKLEQWWFGQLVRMGTLGHSFKQKLQTRDRQKESAVEHWRQCTPRCGCCGQWLWSFCSQQATLPSINPTVKPTWKAMLTGTTLLICLHMEAMLLANIQQPEKV